MKRSSLAISLLKQNEQPNTPLDILTPGRISSFLSFQNTPDWGPYNCHSPLLTDASRSDRVICKLDPSVLFFVLFFPSVSWLKGTSCEAIVGQKERRQCRKRHCRNVSHLFMQLTCDFRTNSNSLICPSPHIPFSHADGL